jgi:hypothetical protein
MNNIDTSKMPPGRDNIPATHPRRIAKLAAVCTADDLKREPEEVRKLVAKLRAADACIGIFDDYDESELASLPPSVRRAWQVGQSLRA